MLDQLIKYILYTIDFVINIFYGFLLVSYYIGKNIFIVIVHIYNTICVSWSSIVVFLEEFGNFLTELAANIGYLLNKIEYSVHSANSIVLNGISRGGNNVLQSFDDSKRRTKYFIEELVELFSQSVRLVSDAVLIIGDGILFLPKTIVITLDSLLVWLLQLSYTIITLLTNVVQSVVKDIFRYSIGMTVVFLLLKFRWKIFRALRHIARAAKRKLQNWTQNTVRVISPRINLQRLPIASPTKSKPSDYNNNVCIICHDRPKCVLLMPCKHLCMCEECSSRYSDFRSQCPLCRRNVQTKISVYI